MLYHLDDLHGNTPSEFQTPIQFLCSTFTAFCSVPEQDGMDVQDRMEVVKAHMAYYDGSHAGDHCDDVHGTAVLTPVTS